MGSGDSKLRFRKAVIQLTTKTQVSLRLKGRWSAAFKVPAGSRWTQMWTLNQFSTQKCNIYPEICVLFSVINGATVGLHLLPNHHFIHVVKMFDLVNKSLKCWPERVYVTAGEFKLLLPVRLHLHQIDSAPNKRIWVFKDSKMNWLTSTMFWLKLVLQPRKCRFLPVYFQSSSWMRITLFTLWPLWCSPSKPQTMPSGISSGPTPPPPSRTSSLWFQPRRSGPSGRNLPQIWQPSATRWAGKMRRIQIQEKKLEHYSRKGNIPVVAYHLLCCPGDGWNAPVSR